jgi:hypothetical protein
MVSTLRKSRSERRADHLSSCSSASDDGPYPTDTAANRQRQAMPVFLGLLSLARAKASAATSLTTPFFGYCWLRAAHVLSTDWGVGSPLGLALATSRKTQLS